MTGMLTADFLQLPPEQKVQSCQLALRILKDAFTRLSSICGSDEERAVYGDMVLWAKEAETILLPIGIEIEKSGYHPEEHDATVQKIAEQIIDVQQKLELHSELLANEESDL